MHTSMHASMHRLGQKTKIVATIGPASDSLEKLRELIVAGMDVTRINFSHGTPEYHASLIAKIRQA
ncbi:MAG: pyruvate kinase, partial [Polyangiaceae bacterium]|nr:pyruvate kinase [Polyangiaceae bacterium]